jgi:hypothetical protein
MVVMHILGVLGAAVLVVVRVDVVVVHAEVVVVVAAVVGEADVVEVDSIISTPSTSMVTFEDHVNQVVRRQTICEYIG